MNSSLRLHPPFAAPRSRFGAGVAVSLILHGLLILGYHYSTPAPVENPPPAQRMTVWLHPAKPTPALAPDKTTASKLASATRSSASPTIVSRPERIKAITPAQAAQPASAEEARNAATQTAAPASNAVDPLHPETATGRFDMQAALKQARKEANRKDPARAAMPVSQLDDHPLYPEQNTTELARNIDSAKRPSCLKGGSIFSPLIWLMDKKDSGCKF